MCAWCTIGAENVDSGIVGMSTRRLSVVRVLWGLPQVWHCVFLVVYRRSQACTVCVVISRGDNISDSVF